jgi:hypothetical protein
VRRSRRRSGPESEEISRELQHRAAPSGGVGRQRGSHGVHLDNDHARAK